MGLWNREYDRSRVIARAERAQRSGRLKKALALYGEVIEREPGNAELRGRIAPLLVLARRHDEAWDAYAVGEAAYVKQGRSHAAISLLRDATKRLPRDPRAWLALAERQLERGRPAEAKQALLEGRRRFRGRGRRDEALQLLRAARRIDPADAALAADLAWLHARRGEHPTARTIVRELGEHGACPRWRLRVLECRLAAHGRAQGLVAPRRSTPAHA